MHAPLIHTSEMDASLRHRPDTDTLEIRLMPPATAVEELLSIAKHINSFICQATQGVIWQIEPCVFHVVADQPRTGGQAERPPPYLYCTHRFQDNLDDEWLCIALLHTWLKTEYATSHSIVAQCLDTCDGEFLCVETADALPEWMDPDRMGNRVYLSAQGLHALPYAGAEGAPCEVPSISSRYEGARAVRALSPALTLLPSPVQAALAARLEHYPARYTEGMHTARVYLPSPAAHALSCTPWLIAPSVHALQGRDERETAAGLRLRHCMGTGETAGTQAQAQLLPVSVTMTRVQYAQLACQSLHIPRVLVPLCPPEVGAEGGGQGGGEYRAYSIGWKIAVGLEICAVKGEVKGKHAAGVAPVLLGREEEAPLATPCPGITLLTALALAPGPLHYSARPRADRDDSIAWMEEKPESSSGGAGAGAAPHAGLPSAIASLVAEMEGELLGKGRGRGRVGQEEEEDGEEEGEEEEEEEDDEDTRALREVLQGVKAWVSSSSGPEGVEEAGGNSRGRREAEGAAWEEVGAEESSGSEGEEGHEEGSEADEDGERPVSPLLGTTLLASLPLPHLTGEQVAYLEHLAHAQAHAQATGAPVPPLPDPLQPYCSALLQAGRLPEADDMHLPVLLPPHDALLRPAGAGAGGEGFTEDCLTQPWRVQEGTAMRVQVSRRAGGGRTGLGMPAAAGQPQEGEEASLQDLMHAMDSALGVESEGRLGSEWGQERMPGSMSGAAVGLALAQGLAGAVEAQGPGGKGPGTTLLAGAGVRVPAAWRAGAGSV